MNLWPEASDRLVDQLEEQLKPKRFLHVLGVLHTALGLAASHGVPPEPVAWAALLHDMCKSVNKRELLRMIERDGERMPPEDLEFPGIWHGWAAAGEARRCWGIRDEQILEAVRHHSTGHPAHGVLGKILVLADHLEPNRNSAAQRRPILERAHRDLDAALAEVLESKIFHMRAKDQPVHPRALMTLASLQTVAKEA